MSNNPSARCPPRRALRVLGIVVVCASLLATWTYIVPLTPGAGAAAGSGADPGADPPVLIALITEYEEGGNEDNAEAEQGPTILTESMVFVDEIVLAGLAPPGEMGEPGDQGDWIAGLPVVRVELFEAAKFDVEFTSGRPRWVNHAPWEGDPDSFVLSGRIIAHASGSDAGGFFVLLSRPGAVMVSGHLNGFGEFRLRLLGEMFYEAEHFWATAPEHECEEHLGGSGAGGGGGTLAGNGNGNGAGCPEPSPGDCDGECPTECGSGCDEGCFIDLLVLYTPLAEDTYEADPPMQGTIEDFIVSEVESLNQVLRASEIVKPGEPETIFRLVGMGNTDDITEGPAIVCLADPWNECLDSVHDFRDAIRADLVAVLMHSGLGNAIRPTSFSLTEESTGFSVAEWQAQVKYFTFHHEIGHNLGFGHVKGECGSCGPICTDPCDCVCTPETGQYEHTFIQDFAFGWELVLGSVPYMTVMNGCSSLLEHKRIPYFSNPEVVYCDNGNCADTGKDNCANNALTMRGDDGFYGTRFLVAQHRTSHDTTDTTTKVQSRCTVPPDFDFLPPEDALETPAISFNGQDIVFTGGAGQWGFNENNNPGADIYLFTRESGMVHLVSHDFSQTGDPHFERSAGHDSANPVISGNRGTVAYTRKDVEGVDQIIAYARTAHVVIGPPTEEIASRGSDTASGPGPDADGDCANAAINGDGTQIVFEATPQADNILPVAFNDQQIIVRNRNPDTGPTNFNHTEVISRTDADQSGNYNVADADCFEPAISACGRFVAYSGRPSNIIGTTNGVRNIILMDRDANESGIFDERTMGAIETIRITEAIAQSEFPEGDSFRPSLVYLGDEDIVRVVYHSLDWKMTPSGWIPVNNQDEQVFLAEYDVENESVEENVLVTRHATESQAANGRSKNAQLSRSGRYIVLQSTSTELMDGIPGSPGPWRIFLYSIEDQHFIAWWDVNDIPEYSTGDLVNPDVSKGGRFIAFQAKPTSGDSRIYVHDRGPQLLGDLNGDGVVDEEDLEILKLNWGNCPCCAADFNRDGRVDEGDLEILCNSIIAPHPECP